MLRDFLVARDAGDAAVCSNDSEAYMRYEEKCRICVNLLHDENSIDEAIYNVDRGAIPLSLERPSSPGGTKDPIEEEVRRAAKNSQQGGSDEYFLNLYLEEHSGQPPSDGELEQYVFDKQNPSEKVFDELYERAHCSAMICYSQRRFDSGGRIERSRNKRKSFKKCF